MTTPEQTELTRAEAIALHEDNAVTLDREATALRRSPPGGPWYEAERTRALADLERSAREERELAELARVFEYPYALAPDSSPEPEAEL